MGQVLTLADLTPAGSEPNLLSKGRRGTPLITNSQPLRSSYTDLRNVSTHLSPRDQEVYQVYYSVKFLQNVVGFFNTFTIMQYQYIFNLKGDKDEGNIKWGILFLSTLSLERLYGI